MDTAFLAAQHCLPRKGPEHRVDAAQREALLRALPEWRLAADGQAIVRELSFADFHRTMGFVNALAYLANREDHHPDLEIGYGYCRVRWSTHDVGGLSMNDFVCAAKVDALLA